MTLTLTTQHERSLEIGPGENPLPGFDTFDTVARAGVDYVACWGADPLPLESDSYAFVYASHVLEHIPWYRTHDALREVYRILRPGGKLEVWVPDFAYIIDCYRGRRCGDSWRRHNPESDPMKWVNGRLFTYGPTDENWHRACFDEPYLSQCLRKSGFIQLARIGKRSRGITHGPIDLGMQGVKP